MGVVLIAAVVALITSLWLFLRRPSHPVDQLPGPPTLPYIGNLLLFTKSKEALFIDFNKIYRSFAIGGIFRTWLTKYIPIIHITAPKHLETILSNVEHISKGQDYDFLAEWLGNSLLISNGAKWHSRRKLLTPAFHFNILEQFVPVFCDKTRILVEKLQSASNANPEGIDITPYVTRCALDIICQTAMGHNIQAQEKLDSPYVSAVYELIDLLVIRVFRPWLHPGWLFRLFPAGRRHDKCLKVLHDFTKKVIRERRETFQKSKLESDQNEKDNDIYSKGSKKRTAFLDLLLSASEHDPSLTDEEIRAEVDTFMFEGHDTTAMGMSWILFYISAYPEVQTRCVEELEEIFGGSDHDPNLSDLGGMKYLERVIKETLRLRPSVVTISRASDHNLKLEGYDSFPAKTAIHVNIYNTHRNTAIYPDPEKFDPDRFLPDNCVGRHPYAYIPFSAGPRNCIGQKFAMLEMKAVVSTLLRQFRLESCDPEKFREPFADIILRPKYGLMTRFYPR